MSSDLERFLAQARGAVGTAAAKLVHVDHLIQTETRAAWELNNLRGRLVELSARGATATLTAAVELVVAPRADSSTSRPRRLFSSHAARVSVWIK